LIHKPLQERLWPYLGGIARANKMSALAIGGIEDHIHVLLSIPPPLSLSKAIQLLKGNSSKWIHDSFPEHQDFQWQEGYGAFSIGISGIPETTAYINSQAAHHKTRSYADELIAFLKAHSIHFESRDLEN
jgi:REP element-mobilizing transposase RayT